MSNLLDVVDLCLYHMLYNGGVHSQGVAGDREGVGADWHHHSHTHTGLHLQPDLVTQIDSGNYRYMPVHVVIRAPPTPNVSSTTVSNGKHRSRKRKPKARLCSAVNGVKLHVYTCEQTTYMYLVLVGHMLTFLNLSWSVSATCCSRCSTLPSNMAVGLRLLSVRMPSSSHFPEASHSW